MKRFALIGLSILCLSLTATTSVKAEPRTQQIAMTTATIRNTAIPKLTPFALVSLAYQGEYRSQGIPGFGSFQSATSGKTVTAKDLVKVAIEAKQLTPEVQADRDYLNAVDAQLSVNRN